MKKYKSGEKITFEKGSIHGFEYFLPAPVNKPFDFENKKPLTVVFFEQN